MSGFKEKTAYFESIFSNLDKDSDDDDHSASQANKEDSPVETAPLPEQHPPCDPSFIDIPSSSNSPTNVPLTPEDRIVISSSPEIERFDIASSPEHGASASSSPLAGVDPYSEQDTIRLDTDSDPHDVYEPNKDSANYSAKQSNDINNRIVLKFQDGNRKHMRELEVDINEPLQRPKEVYANEFNIDINTVKLFFDGDLIGDQDTAAQLDMEDGCVIDVVLPQTISYVPPPSPIDLTSPSKPSPRGRSCGRGARGARRGRGRFRRR